MKYKMHAGAKVARALTMAPAMPHTFQPTKAIIRIMFGPGTVCASAKKLLNSRSVIQPCVVTTNARTSGRTVGKPPKLIDDSNARCAVNATEAADASFIVLSRFRYAWRRG